MNGCQCQSIETYFDRQKVANYVQSYREEGLEKETQILVQALLKEGVEGQTLLDIGSGMGGLSFELIKRGVSMATNIEASSAFVEATIGEAEREGLSAKTNNIHGEFASLAETIPPADIVTLDKVICCYDDMASLVKSSVAKAKRLYGVIIPIDTWWMKVWAWWDNFPRRIKGNDFRFIVFPVKEVDQLIHDNGMQLLFEQRSSIWLILIYGRPAEPAPGGSLSR